MSSENLLLSVIVSGLFVILTRAEMAPGYITMTFSFKIPSFDYSDTSLNLRSVILQEESNSVIVYDSLDTLKQKSYQSEIFELTILFFTENIKNQFSFTGTLTIKSPRESEKIHEFKKTFKFEIKSLKMISGKLSMSETFYTSQLSAELDVIITSQCKSNYYPENICDTHCVMTKNTKKCDKFGNKICEQGYKLNSETMTCDNNWCWPLPSRCLHGGTCVSLKNRFECQCTISYKGTYCEEYYDACVNFVCPNNTKCSFENDKIHCKVKEQSLKQEISEKSTPIKKMEQWTISMTTMIVISAAIVIGAISLFVTCWACKRPKDVEYRVSEESVNYRPLSYYNYIDAKSNPHSVPISTRDHLHCACKQHDWSHGQMDNYYSLRIPNERVLYPSTRPSSDIARQNGRISRASSIHTTTSNSGIDCDSLPLPPAMEADPRFVI